MNEVQITTAMQRFGDDFNYLWSTNWIHDALLFVSTTCVCEVKTEREADRIMYGIRLQLTTAATLKVKQFIRAVEFIAW